MARNAVERGSTEAPFAFIVPPEQHDEVAARRMVALLLRHGVEVRRAAEPFALGYTTYPAGTVVIPADQPYRPFLMVMLRPQRYPEVRPSTDGAIVKPYDVASWSYPLTMGVEVVEAESPVTGTFETITAADWPRSVVAVDGAAAGALIPAGADRLHTAVNRLLAAGRRVSRLPGSGDVWVDFDDVDRTTFDAIADELWIPTRELPEPPETTAPVRPLRVGLFKPWVASMDEGWTRWVLEQYEFPVVSLSNEQIRSGEFTELADVLLFPDIEPSVIAKGTPGPSYWGRFVPLPPEYSGGIDEWTVDDGADNDGSSVPTPGGKRIEEWVRAGGTVIALDSSTAYFIELFDAPVENTLEDLPAHDFLCPGSTLRVLVDTASPLAWGMRGDDAVYFAGSPAFTTRVPDPRFERRVIIRYPDDAKDILLSGYLEGGEHLERRAAVVELTVGKGRIILIGFRAQHRGQPLRTFKLLFNALYDVGPLGP